MKLAKLADVKNQLSRYIERVRRGERVRITLRGIPVAELAPIPVHSDNDDGLLDELEHAGIARRGIGPLPRELLRPGPRIRRRSIAEVVLAERESGH